MHQPGPPARRSRPLTRRVITLLAAVSVVMVTTPMTASASDFDADMASTTGALGFFVAVTPDGSHVATSALYGQQVIFLDRSTTPVSAVPVDLVGTSWQLAFTPDSSQAWVTLFAGGEGGVIVVDPATGETIGGIPTGASPTGITIGTTSLGDRAYVANAGDGTVSVIDVDTRSVIDTVAVGEAPLSVSISGDGNRVYVLNAADSSVSVIDTSDNSVDTPITDVPEATYEFAASLVVAPDGQRLYVSVDGDVRAYDTTTDELVGTAPRSSPTVQMAVSPDSSVLYVGDVGGPQAVDIYRTASFGNPLPAEPSDSITLPGHEIGVGVAVDPATIGDLIGTIYLTATNQEESYLFGMVSPVPSGPGNPTQVAGRPASGHVLVNWELPALDGGSAITGYHVTTYAGGTAVAGATCSATPPLVPPLTCDVTGLTNGTAYTFTATAINDNGTSIESVESAEVIPIEVPDPPVHPVARAGDTAAVISWDAPFSDGGHPITQYTVQAWTGGAPVSGQTCNPAAPITAPLSCTVAGLSNGTEYTFRIIATNEVGDSPPSAATDVITAGLSAPTAPAGVVGTRGNGQVAVTWEPPAADGGQDITSYTVHTYEGDDLLPSLTCRLSAPFTPPLTCSVAELENGISYRFTVTATNDAGTSPESSPSDGVRPAGPPTAPRDPSAAGGDGTATVLWSAAGDNGSSITAYDVQALLDNAPVSGAGCVLTAPFPTPLSCDIPGLTNGAQYTFAVTATNDVDTGVAATTPAVVIGLPGDPVNVLLTVGNGEATVTWDPPATGVSGVTSYTVTGYPAGVPQAPACTLTAPFNTPRTCTVTDLPSRTLFFVTVTATNDNGTGAPGMSVDAYVDVPSLPSITTVTAGDRRADVTWWASEYYDFMLLPASTSFTVQAYDSGTPVPGATCTLTPPFPDPFGCTVSGLTNGTAYTFTVAATNVVGAGPASRQSAPVVPVGAPTPPLDTVATPGAGQATVTWSPPANEGGSAIVNYFVQARLGGRPVGTPCTLTAPFTPPLTCTVPGLAAGVTYDMTVTASNGIATSQESASASVTIPAVTPGAPTWVGAVAGDGQVTVTWTEPADDGGAPVTSYRVAPAAVGVQAFSAFAPLGSLSGCTRTAPFDAPLTCTVTGLTNGTAYTFTVAAANAVGIGEFSVPSGPVTPRAGAPDPPPPAPAPPAADSSGSGSGTDGSGGGGAANYGYLADTGTNISDTLALAGLLLGLGALALLVAPHPRGSSTTAGTKVRRMGGK